VGGSRISRELFYSPKTVPEVSNLDVDVDLVPDLMEPVSIFY